MGFSAVAIANRVGHESEKITYKYAHLFPSIQGEMAEALEEDVDIRYIQQMLGHSSITTTQIYTHTSINKQKNILSAKHPRNKLEIGI